MFARYGVRTTCQFWHSHCTDQAEYYATAEKSEVADLTPGWILEIDFREFDSTYYGVRGICTVLNPIGSRVKITVVPYCSIAE